MSILNKIGKAFSALNPISIHDSQALRKLASESHASLARASNFGEASQVVTRFAGGAKDVVAKSIEIAKKNMSDATANVGRDMSDYMAGYNIGSSKATMSASDIAFNRNMRVGTAAALGLYAGSNLLMGRDNPVASTMGFAAKAVGHTAVAHGINAIRPGWGTAYGAIAAVNMFRSGDNLGPF